MVFHLFVKSVFIMTSYYVNLGLVKWPQRLHTHSCTSFNFPWSYELPHCICLNFWVPTINSLPSILTNYKFPCNTVKHTVNLSCAFTSHLCWPLFLGVLCLPALIWTGWSLVTGSPFAMIHMRSIQKLTTFLYNTNDQIK